MQTILTGRSAVTFLPDNMATGEDCPKTRPLRDSNSGKAQLMPAALKKNRRLAVLEDEMN
jgi:hypothetical protein